MSNWDQEDSGLAYTSEVTDAYFEYDDNYRNGEEPRLVLETVGDNGPRFERIGLGKGWVADDDGKTVSHPTKNTFHRSSGIRKFIRSVLECDGAREILDGRGEQNEAAVWKGLTIGFDNKTDTFTSDTGEEVEYSYTVATSISDDGAETVSAGGDDEVQAELDALWESTKPDHTKFMEQAYQIGAVLLDPKLTKQVEDPKNWA